MDFRGLTSGRLYHAGAILARAGEGAVYHLVNKPTLLLKVFDELPTPRAIEKHTLLAGLKTKPAATALPLEVVIDPATRVPVGFVQPYFANAYPLTRLLDSKGRITLGFPDDLHFRVQLCRLLAEAMARLHSCQLVMGDVSDSNFLLGYRRSRSLTTAYVIDCNSLQVARRSGTGYDLFVSGVATEAYAAPEVQPTDWSTSVRSVYSDVFGLAVLCWQILFNGSHPFAVVTPAHVDVPPLGERIEKRLFPFVPATALPTGWRPAPLHPSPAILPYEVEALFVTTFTTDDPRDRPQASEWIRAMSRWAELLQPTLYSRVRAFVFRDRTGFAAPASPLTWSQIGKVVVLITLLTGVVLIPFWLGDSPRAGPHDPPAASAPTRPTPRPRAADPSLFPAEFLRPFQKSQE